MTVKEFTKICHDTIIIYQEVKNDSGEYEYNDLYKGLKYNIPEVLLNKEIYCCGACGEKVIELQVK